MATKEYLTALVKLLKQFTTSKEINKARGSAGGSRGPRGVEAEQLVGMARITPRTVRGLNDEQLYDHHENFHNLAAASKKDIYKNAHNFISGEMRRRGLDHDEDAHEFNIDVNDVHVNQIMPEAYESDLQFPYPNEHACRLVSPSEFVKFRRNNNTNPNTIIGFRKDGSSDLQTFRYPVSSWTEAKARAHCATHSGSFAAATKGEVKGGSG